MWRRNALRFGNLPRENQDSDQSISDEEEVLEREQTGNTISLDGPGNKKVLSQLEILRDSYELHPTEKGLISSHERKGCYHMDDEVEVSLFDEGDCSSHCPRIASATHTNRNEGMVHLPTMASISHSAGEIISDEKINPPILRSARENVDGTWSEASREVEALVCLNENSSCPSHSGFVKERKSSKGGEGRKKVKPKFIFLLHSRKEDLSMVIGDRRGRTSSDNSPPPDEIGAVADEDMDELISESRLIYHDKECKQPENHIVPFEQTHKRDFQGHSMAEFLNSFEESNNQLQGSSALDIKKRGRRAQMILKRNTSPPLGDRNLDEDDSLEAFDSGSPFCSDDEENHQNLKLVIPRRTMADQFHEAFGTVSAIDERPHTTCPRPLCSGMYGKLQQVMQSEKERDMDYLKNLSSETGFEDERMWISVRILTRSLEAKLIVCSCTPVEDGKNSYRQSNLQMTMKGVARTLTIIFNPRICSDVNLEVGNLICIRPPWKEVQVKGKEDVIYLCSYFTQVQP